jgi:hypothetical protein
MQVQRTRFFRIGFFKRYRVAAGETGPYTRIGRLTGMASTIGQPTAVANLAVRVIRERDRYHWPR